MSSEYTVDDLRMVRLQEGDTTAFEELVEDWNIPVLQFFRRNLRDEHLAEDFTQETLLRLYRRAWDYLPTGRFRGYLFRIAQNLLIDHMRRAGHKAAQKSLPIPEGVVEDRQSPLERVADAEQRSLLEALLCELPHEQRVAVTLHHLRQMAISEVAKEMSATVPTTKGRLRLAKGKLQASLSRHGYATALFESD